MESGPLFLLAAGLIVFILYLLIVVTRLFFIKKQTITFDTASLLFISFILVASSFYIVLTEKNGMAALKHIMPSKTEQLDAKGETMQEPEESMDETKADSNEVCQQNEDGYFVIGESGFQLIDVSLLEEEWNDRDEKMNVAARFSLRDTDFIVVENEVGESSEVSSAAQSKLELLDRNALKSCLSR
ncbi:hypothetical protein [Oceanobacillus jeddahense]|uniref:Uncharacterized protein n=1 Tax=Oceanobacillus jeddahense TaxID=1462527 RepID=A0ABY5JRT9_9BACI|nr:hypothetical protein [Oceanobacillus jeddahense]UUI03021.1 hypothetical protein NP439_23820 [Oceanobacillus jeddahense]